MTARRVAVVGAGVSGLVSIKSCLEEGLEPVCFEQHGDIGGIWYQTDEFRPGQNARISDALVLNTSKGMFCFSDHPFPDDTPTYPTGNEMHGYLMSYAQTFGLLKYIQFNTKVHNVKRSSDYETTGFWDIETEVNGDRKWTTFDGVFVCSGFFHVAHYPTIEGFDRFEGTSEHSQTFFDGSRYRGQNILVIGNGSSAGDLAVDISRYAKQVYLSVGKGAIVTPRLMQGGTPLDFILSRTLTMIPVPQSVLGKLLFRKANARLDHVAYKVLPWHLPPKGTVMINDELPMRLACGKVRIAGNLVRFGARHAEFDDGTQVTDIDGVVFGTGIKRKLPFLDRVVGADDATLNLYKMMFPVQLPHDSLVMIGYFRTMGPIPPISELQARLAARVIAGKHKLPDRTVMRRDVDQWNEKDFRINGYCKYSFPNLQFREELATELGVKPSILDLLKLGTSVFYQYYFGPAFNVHYRLVGPGAWAGAVRACAEAQHSGYTKQIRKLPRTESRVNKFKVIFGLLVASGIVFAYRKWGNGEIWDLLQWRFQ